MRVLYYCPEYYSHHGGRTHARGFFGSLGELQSVSACFLYPKSKPQENIQDDNDGKTSRKKLWFLPQTVRRIVRLLLPRPHLTRALIEELVTNECDAIVIRAGSKHPSIRQIKKICPNVLVCLEINSAFFDECFPGLPLRNLFQKLEVMRFGQADAIVVVSTYLKAYLTLRGLSPAKILVNQNGVDVRAIIHTGLSNVRETYDIPKDAFVIGYVGGMETFRRLPEVVSCIAELRRAGNDDIYLLMIGDGEEMPTVQDAIKMEGEVLEDAVKLAGWQEHAKIPKFLAAFDIAIFPFTNAYCSPLKLFEYLGVGLPTIGPDTPAVREVFNDDEHLKLVKQDGSDFSSTILELKANPQICIALGNSGKQLVLKKYTWKKNAERVMEHIQKIKNSSKWRSK